MKEPIALTFGEPTSAPSISDSRLTGIQGIVQYRRKDGGHGWIVMAAYDTEHMAQRYAFKCARDDSGNWPWEYRALDLAGAVLPPLDAEEQDRLTAAHRLTNAAPNLLTVLQHVYRTVMTAGLDGDGRIERLCQRDTNDMRAAIRKALPQEASAEARSAGANPETPGDPT